jgi:hypothetical protein
VLGGFPQGHTQFLDGGIDAVIELHNRVVRPQPHPDLLAQHYFAWMFKQQKEDLNRLFPELNSDPVLA